MVFLLFGFLGVFSFGFFGVFWVWVWCGFLGFFFSASVDLAII